MSLPPLLLCHCYIVCICGNSGKERSCNNNKLLLSSNFCCCCCCCCFVCVCVNARVCINRAFYLSVLFFDVKLLVDLGRARAQAHLGVTVVSDRNITFVFKIPVTCWIVLRYCFGSGLFWFTCGLVCLPARQCLTC